MLVPSRRFNLCIAVAGVAIGLPAAAAPVVIKFTGTIRDAPTAPGLPEPFAGAVAGESATLSVYADNSTVGTPIPFSEWVDYGAGLTGWKLTIGASTITQTISGPTSPERPHFLIANDAVVTHGGADVIQFGFDLSGFILYSVLRNQAATAISSTAFPSSLSLSDWDFGNASLRDSDGNRPALLIWDSVSIASAVPLPAPVALGALGLAPIALVRRRR